MPKALYKIELKLHENVRILRKERHWSQQKLAENTGLSINTICKLEQGLYDEPTIQTVRKIADAFGITVDRLIGHTVKNIV